MTDKKHITNYKSRDCITSSVIFQRKCSSNCWMGSSTASRGKSLDTEPACHTLKLVLLVGRRRSILANFLHFLIAGGILVLLIAGAGSFAIILLPQVRECSFVLR